MNKLVTCGIQLCLGALFLGGSLGLQADTIHYRWTNEKGGTVYSDRPPPEGTQYEVVSSETGKKRIVSGDEGVVPLKVRPTPSNDFEQVDERSIPDAGSNEVLCEKARRNLVELQQADVVSLRDDKGETRPMTQEEREDSIRTTESQIRAYCS